MESPKLCDLEHCRSHEYVVKTMERLETVSIELSRNQAEIVILMTKLADLTERVVKLEGNQEGIRKFMYKIGGAIALFTILSPLLVVMAQHFIE